MLVLMFQARTCNYTKKVKSFIPYISSFLTTIAEELFATFLHWFQIFKVGHSMSNFSVTSFGKICTGKGFNIKSQVKY